MLLIMKTRNKAWGAWWSTVNQITAKSYHASVGSIIDPDILNLYFQDTNLDQQYSMPELVPIPEVRTLEFQL